MERDREVTQRARSLHVLPKRAPACICETRHRPRNPSRALVGQFKVRLQGEAMVQLCGRDLSPYPLSLSNIRQPPKLTAPLRNWMGGHEKPLAGSGVPSPAPHKEVLTLSEHVLARKDFFFFAPRRDVERAF